MAEFLSKTLEILLIIFAVAFILVIMGSSLSTFRDRLRKKKKKKKKKKTEEEEEGGIRLNEDHPPFGADALHQNQPVDGIEDYSGGNTPATSVRNLQLPADSPGEIPVYLASMIAEFEDQKEDNDPSSAATNGPSPEKRALNRRGQVWLPEVCSDRYIPQFNASAEASNSIYDATPHLAPQVPENENMSHLDLSTPAPHATRSSDSALSARPSFSTNDDLLFTATPKIIHTLDGAISSAPAASAVSEEGAISEEGRGEK
ncbi:hypothetical protein BJ878DRAFT_538020 [Calycina marina]|uniref:Uncharacterized protein n=1 Tax=Calycina marina TaxID=1763456 RepID=A0A9P7ZC54_9HELO|nr:hypothetical protein BJ878DRAFT_538020 [Calycina marina]